MTAKTGPDAATAPARPGWRVIQRCVLVACLLSVSFPQAPTIKVGARIRVSDFLAILLVPAALRLLLRARDRLPRSVKRAVASLLALVVTLGVLGIVVALTDSTLGSRASGYFVSPMVRTLLESTRAAEGLVIVCAAIGLSCTREQFVADMRALAIGMVCAAAYGVYQSASKALALGLPLLPGTLSSLNARPYGPMYEPRALGSLAAVGMLLVWWLIARDRRFRLGWILGLALLGLAFLLAASFSGIAALTAGVATLGVIWFRVTQRRVRIARSGVLVAVGVLIAACLGGLVMTRLLGSEAIFARFNQYWLAQTLSAQASGYRLGLDSFRSTPLGLGQGLLILRVGGVPGGARFIAEGGVLGCALLLAFLVSSAGALRGLTRSFRVEDRELGAFLGAAAVATAVSALAYVNLTDAWLTVSVSLPIIGAAAVSGRTS